MVRDFEPSDAQASSELLREAFQWFHKGNKESWLWKAFEPANLAANSKAQEILVSVNTERGELAGYIASSTTPYGVAYVPTLAVKPKFQRSGLGKLLLEEKFRKLQQKGIRKVWLLVTSVNTSAISFYLRNGFVIEGYLRDHTGPGYDELLFSKFL
jgi:ribosomal protein S18 acetylase RimI-like enzyme